MDLCFLKNLKGRATTRSLVASISQAIDAGMLTKGEKLPSSREIAQFTGSSRTTVVRAFDELIARGYLSGKKGQATFVEQLCRSNDKELISFEPPAKENQPTFSGKLPVELIPVRDWQKCLALQYSKLLAGSSGCEPPFHNLGSLKQAICGFMRRSEGILCSPASVFVYTGTDSALLDLARMTAGTGLACETKGSAAYELFRKAGAKVIELSLDNSGPRVDAMGTSAQDLQWLYITPTGSRPSGITLSAERRYELLEWSGIHAATIIENATGTEFQYSAKSNPSLFAQDRSGSVIYYRSLAGLFHPLTNLEFLIVPDKLLDEFLSFHPEPDTAAQSEHLALADFINDGYLEKHIRSSWKTLRRRRQALIFALTQRFDRKLEIFASHAGTQVVIRTHQNWAKSEVSEAARAAGLTVAENEIVYADREAHCDTEYTIDFSTLQENQAERAVGIFASELMNTFIELPAVTHNSAAQALLPRAYTESPILLDAAPHTSNR